jgi:3,4-dihydroxy 2-butanone 4-phosphate synthase/GTP cyclohydrolase II
MEALERFKRGKPIIILDDADREDEADVVIAAEDVTEEVMTFMINHGTGIVCCPLLQEQAVKLELPYMVVKNTDPHQTAFTVSVDHEETGTGVSSRDRTLTAKYLASDDSKPQHFKRPGHMFPLIAKPGLLQERRGHTEASVALCILTNKKPVAVITELMDGNGNMLNGVTIREFSIRHDIPIITVSQIADMSLDEQSYFSPLRISETCIPTAINGKEDVLTLRVFENALTKNSYAVIFKTLDRTLRIHSVCLTGDVFHSMKCDCYQQLMSSLEYITIHGGVIIYCMNHEGRGIGLRNKIDAYQLMSKECVDTYTANKLLGFKEDEREYSDIVHIMKNIFGTLTGPMTLLSGNPAKINMIKSLGYHVTEKVLPIFRLSHNKKYLHDKNILGGHIFHFKENIKIPTLNKIHMKNVLIVRTDGWNKELMDLYYNNIVISMGENGSMKTLYCTGTMELPQLLFKEDLSVYDTVIALGIIMQGVTDHHVVVAVTTAIGLQNVSLSRNCPIINGVVLAKTDGEVLERISLEKCIILLNS